LFSLYLSDIFPAGFSERALVPKFSSHFWFVLRISLAGLALTGSTHAMAETMRLPSSDTEIVLPDDGTSWRVQQAQTSDFLIRTTPAEPAVEMELAYFEAQDCWMLEAFEDRPQDKDAPMFADNVPIGWASGPVLVGEGGSQRVLCLPAPAGSYLAYLYMPKGQYDGKPFHNLLKAILNAAFPDG
jgi:hypothetical protein